MSKARRPRSDSTTGALDAAAQVGELLEANGLAKWPHAVPRMPEGPLRERADEIFLAGLANRAPKDWDGHALILMARYANLQAVQIEDELTLALAGSVIADSRGRPLENPLMKITQGRNAILQSLARQLGVSTVGIDRRQLANSAAKVCCLADHIRATEGDGLIAPMRRL